MNEFTVMYQQTINDLIQGIELLKDQCSTSSSKAYCDQLIETAYSRLNKIELSYQQYHSL